METDERGLPAEVKNYMAFALQKLDEVQTLSKLIDHNPSKETLVAFEENVQAHNSWKNSKLVNNTEVKTMVCSLSKESSNIKRNKPFAERIKLQQAKLNLPLFPTTMIGSLPQTEEVRSVRRKFIKGQIDKERYRRCLEDQIRQAIEWQEKIGMDVLVHGEFERNDMVEYFGEQLNGFAFTQNGWVQSYGSRGVKPPVIFGDVWRKEPMTLSMTIYAQLMASKPVKGMLTGPITILQWSFVRTDQPRETTAQQIALAIPDEVLDLEKSGIGIIQIVEPALREGLPLKKSECPEYLNWAVRAFKLSYWGVKDETQIHTHMCYAEFNNIMGAIAEMDADVISIETSRSQMELLNAFSRIHYPNQIGPGVYDIH